MERSNGNCWGQEIEIHREGRLLEMIMDSMIVQYIGGETRYRRKDEPYRLDLVFTKGVDLK